MRQGQHLVRRLGAIALACALLLGCPPDSDVEDSGVSDRGGADIAARDVAVPDTAGRDVDVPDTGMRDVAAADTAVADVRHEAGAADRASVDLAVADVAHLDGAGGADGPASCQGDGYSGWLDERGFCIRTPIERSVPWETMPEEVMYFDILDVDYVCSLDYENIHGFIYVQSHATQCRFGCDCDVDGAWFSDGAQVQPVTASYDWGGNHNNDSISVEVGGYQFTFYHSSFGFGWRACLPPDCINVYTLADASLYEEGCTYERTLPQVCVRVTEGGEVPELVDTFAPCPGDPNVDAG